MLGKRISDLRKEIKISQKELSSYLNISSSTIAMYELDKRQPSFEILERISEYFNVSTDYLLGKSEIKNAERLLNYKKSNDECIPESEEMELLENFRLLNKHEKNIIRGKISELIYNKNTEENKSS